MLYLNKLKTKILLILLCGLITLHVAFVSTKTYSGKIDDKNRRRPPYHDIEIINASEMQYQNTLSDLTVDYKAMLVNNTEVKYLKNLPEKSILYIYLGYFLIATGFILTAKFTINESTNEN